MTVTQSYSLSLTYTSLRMYLPQTAPAAVPASSQNPSVPSAADTVTLSPQATAPPVVDEESASTHTEGSVSETAEAPAADTPAAPPSRAARRAEVLHDALDTDQDGTITKEEFVDSAMALLRRAGARHHYRHHGGHDEGHDHGNHESRGTSRLERKLERLFERVDVSGEGNVDQAELTDALAQVRRGRRPGATETPAPPSSDETPSTPPSPEPSTPSSPGTPAPPTVTAPPPPPAMFYTSVTVMIAVKQYTSVGAMSV